MLLHLLKNFLHRSRRESGYTLLLIVTVALGLVFVICMISLADLQTGNIAPEINRKRTLLLNEAKFIKDGKNVERNPYNHNLNFTSAFLNKHIKTMKSPEMVSICSNPGGRYNFSEDPFSEKFFKTLMTDDIFWKIMSFQFIEGKPYTAEQLANKAPVAVIDSEMSELLFGTTKSIGKIFQNKGLPWRELTVIGVIEKANPMSEFAASVYSPYTAYGTDENKFRNKEDEEQGIYFYRGQFQAIVLAQDASDFSTIQNELNKIASTLNQQGKVEEFEGIKPVLNDRFSAWYLAWDLDEMTAGIATLLASFFFVILLIPVFTIIKINTSRLAERLQEIGLRHSFGARKIHLRLQFVIENLLITLIGGILGIILSAIIFNFLLSIALPDMARIDFNLSWGIVGWATLAIFVFSLFTGLIPAWRASKINPVYALSGGNNQLSLAKNKAYDKISGLTIGGIFICMLFMYGLLLMFYSPIISGRWMLNLDAHVVQLYQQDNTSYSAGFEQMKKDLKNLEAVKQVSFTDASPHFAFGLNDYETPTGSHQGKILKVDEAYKEILKLELLKGQWFTGNDKIVPERKNAILSADAAEKFFGTIDCLGQTFSDKDGQQYQITGITKTRKLRTRGSLEKYQVFVYESSTNQALVELMPDANLTKTWQEIKTIVAQNNGTQADYELGIIDYYKDQSKVYIPFVKSVAVVVFIMLLNAGMGFFAVGWSQAKKRKNEIGVRRASGATASAIYRMIISENLKTSFIAIGIILLPISQLILFFGDKIGQRENWVYAAGLSLVITLTCVVLAALVPARRAAKIQPVEALANE